MAWVEVSHDGWSAEVRGTWFSSPVLVSEVMQQKPLSQNSRCKAYKSLCLSAALVISTVFMTYLNNLQNLCPQLEVVSKQQ